MSENEYDWPEERARREANLRDFMEKKERRTKRLNDTKRKYWNMSFEERMNECVFFVEANSYERHTLWKELKTYVEEEAPDDHDYTFAEAWIELNNGWSIIVGNINGDEDKPVCVSFGYNIIYGELVCFYNATSRYVDHTMVEEWIQDKWPKKYGGNRRAMTDANNFHNCWQECHRICELKDEEKDEESVPG